MTGTSVDAALAALGDIAGEVVRFRDEVTIFVDRTRILSALRAVQEVGFQFLTDLTAVDRGGSEPRFEVVYLVSAPQVSARLRLKVRVTTSDAVLPSAIPIWAGANWLEREVFDLFGIRFEGHPDLRRILMPDDWEGHPLRKNEPLVEEPVEFIGHTPKVPSSTIPKSGPPQGR